MNIDLGFMLGKAIARIAICELMISSILQTIFETMMKVENFLFSQFSGSIKSFS